MKPLGVKNYGSIPHLPGSRLGEGDHHCHEGQAKIATVKVRDRHDRVIVQEKLDGSNTGICKVDGQIIPLTRSGYRAETSPYEQHHVFAKWVMQRWGLFDELLCNGERIVGEWLYQAHGTRYNLPHDFFVPFDLFTQDNVRLPYDGFLDRINTTLPIPRLIHDGGAFSIEEAIKVIKVSGHGAIDPVEGAIWRVERKGKVDFLCKFVHHFKQDGLYLPEVSGKPAVINQAIHSLPCPLDNLYAGITGY